MCKKFQKNLLHSLWDYNVWSGKKNKIPLCPVETIPVSVKSARAMWKVLMVQNCDNDILEGLAVANPPQIQNPLFLSWRD
jgi:hypothetical protein